ncbi:retropepsin-like aspartic protease [Niabella hibiscisoli]|uniref:retropepsin-like aspartic protease n=1 Tax=Niabella hibiscisoli TaxID=1825928 RepID=UPI001F10E4F7|nr:retropepsin-like aspartic protease [Niabella hibiscisoli]MCH5717608.1 aspartyl protease family protein [Niabella hibiscisoli]
MQHFIFLLLSLLSSISLVKAQPVLRSADNKSSHRIPFRITAYNNIIIKAAINEKDTVNLMLHTASSDITLTEEAVKKLNTIQFTGAVDDVKSWGGGGNSSRYSNGNQLTISGLNWSNVEIWDDQNSGQESDGKIGLNFFNGQVLDFDFEKQQLTVGRTLPKNLKKYEKLALASQGANLFVKGDLKIGDELLEAELLLHSGYGGDILLNDAFVQNNKIDQKIKITSEKKLKDAYGNVLTTQKGVLPVLKLGQLQLHNTHVGFFTGTVGRQKISVMGGDILKRFRIIIDAQRQHVYLKPNHFFKSGYSNI